MNRLSLALAGALMLAGANAFPAAENLHTSALGNTYVSGGNIRVATPVAGDLLAAGGQISIDAAVAQDASAAGGVVDVRAPVAQDLRVAGGNLNLENSIGGDLLAAGGSVRVAEKSNVAGSAWLAGSEIIMAGKLTQGARIYGNDILISGDITGPTYLAGRRIRLANGARIHGDLSYASPQALITEGDARVSGTITRQASEWDESRDAHMRRIAAWLHPLFMLSMLLCGILLVMLFSLAVAAAQRTQGTYFLRCLLIGLALLFAVPPVAVLLMITVIGLPLGLMLLALYPVLLLLGYLMALFFVGGKLAGLLKQPAPISAGRQLVFFIVALILVNLLAMIPVLGGLIVIAVFASGMGGLAVSAYHRYRTPSI